MALGKLKTRVNSDGIVAAWSKTADEGLAAAANCRNSDLMASKTNENNSSTRAIAALEIIARGSPE
jgi:hypothetical protein